MEHRRWLVIQVSHFQLTSGRSLLTTGCHSSISFHVGTNQIEPPLAEIELSLVFFASWIFELTSSSFDWTSSCGKSELSALSTTSFRLNVKVNVLHQTTMWFIVLCYPRLSLCNFILRPCNSTTSCKLLQLWCLGAEHNELL